MEFTSTVTGCLGDITNESVVTWSSDDGSILKVRVRRDQVGCCFVTAGQCDVYPRPFGTGPGLSEPADVTPHVLGYDIEVSTALSSDSSLPPPGSPLLCVSMSCSCGELVTIGGKVYGNLCLYVDPFKPTSATTVLSASDGAPEFVSHRCRTEDEMVWVFLEGLRRHSPDFATCHNGFMFDNDYLSYVVRGSTSPVFKWTPISATTCATIMTVPGVTNICTLHFRHKTGRGAIGNSLEAVARSHNLRPKLDVSGTDFACLSPDDNMLRYCVWDACLHRMIAVLDGCVGTVSNLVGFTGCQLGEAARLVSGKVVVKALESYAVSSSRMDEFEALHRKTDEVVQVMGGAVFEPVVGMHTSVTVVDFSAHYPSILCTVGMGADTMTDDIPLDPDMQSAVCLKPTPIGYEVTADGHKVTYRSGGLLSSISRYLSDYRNKNRSNKALSGAVKVVNNSLYGSLAGSMSDIYFPLAASSITGAGRYLLFLAASLAEVMGYTLLYGDTDSIFIRPRVNASLDPHGVVGIVNCIMSYISPASKMGVESTDMTALLISKKRYILARDGELSLIKGMAIVRSDRSPRCCTFSSKVIEAIIRHRGSTAALRDEIRRMFSDLCYSAVGGMRIEDVADRRVSNKVRVFDVHDASRGHLVLKQNTSMGMVVYPSVSWLYRKVFDILEPVLECVGGNGSWLLDRATILSFQSLESGPAVG